MNNRNLLLATCLFLLTGKVWGQKNQLTFYIENRTSTDLYGIFVSGINEDLWGEDILPEDIFEAGSTLTITIPITKESICEQDIKLTFSEDDDNPLIFKNIDFCSLDKMILTQKNNKIYYELQKIESLTFEIANSSNTDFYGVFVNGSEESTWGDDLLPEDLFEAGTVVTVTIPIFKNTTCNQDIKISFSEDDPDPLIFTAINFCKLNRLLITESKRKFFYTLE
jgi:hypothetical protein